MEVMKKKYEPWQVFITFDTEAAQRDCLNKLAIGKTEPPSSFPRR
jgi:hypothetical protein